MRVSFVGELRSVIKGNEFKRKDGSTGYNVNVTVEDETGRSNYFSATEEVFEAYESGAIQKGDYCVFSADYNPQWKYGQFQVKSVLKNQK